MATTGYHDRMRIVCPACAAAYDLADGHVTGGQTVRCARCSREWVPVTAGEPNVVSFPEAGPPIDRSLSPDPVPSVPPSPIPAVLKPLVPSVVPTASAVMAAWGLSIVVLVALGWAAVAWRADVMQAWPPSTRLYAAIGLPGH